MNNMIGLFNRNELTILGLMSGTSADGLDIVCARFNGRNEFPDYHVDYHDFVPYPDEFSDPFKHPLSLTASQIAQLDMKLGKWVAEKISKIRIPFDIISTHGQTLLHKAPDYTLQIGEPLFIRELCGKPVIYDFRTADLVAGGQGAPLIPIVDNYLLRRNDTGVIALNLGGIANLSYLPPKRSDEPILAWDTGPANTLIDKAVMDFTGGHLSYDVNGNMARSGNVNGTWLKTMLEHGFLQADPPKSAGQEQFGDDYYRQIKDMAGPRSTAEWHSFIRTITEMTILSIVKDIHAIIERNHVRVDLVISGGGAENTLIVDRLKTELPYCHIKSFDLPGITGQIKEAFGFAYLGYLFLRGIPGNIPSVTGASKPMILGKIVI